MAKTAAWVRLIKPSLARTFDIEFSTVFSARKSRSPICLLVRPSAASSRMRCSWALRLLSSFRFSGCALAEPLHHFRRDTGDLLADISCQRSGMRLSEALVRAQGPTICAISPHNNSSTSKGPAVLG